MPQLALSFLGPFQVMLDGEPITGFATDKTRALLAYLAVEAEYPHRRDTLAGLLWPDYPHRKARHGLRQALSHLRQTLGDRDDVPFLLVSRETIQFNPHCDHWLDAAAFATLAEECRTHLHRHRETCLPCLQRMERMVELYRGDFLAHFFLSDSSSFEEWATLKREWLRREVARALSLLTHRHERRGEYERARRYARRQVELEPWREEVHRQLMRLLALDGQRSAALAQYETCRQALAEELGVEPTDETTRLYEQIRAGEISPSSPASLHNLPPSPTPFVGRKEELADLADLLADPDCRLVTLFGPGGIGKTRLALQTAESHIGAFAQGVYFVPLTAASSAEHLVPAIADALNFPFDGHRKPKEQLLNYLRQKELLLVLDGMEHLLEGAGVLSEILTRAPDVLLLVTSRERLNLREEWVYAVEGLTYPAEESVEEWEAYSALDLFRQRARQSDWRFSLSEAELPYVAHICRLVEGMPLGVELAAAWVAVRSCREIAQEVERNLDVLTTSMRNVPARQRSVRATFEHSWNLLAEPERRGFRRLSVFRGGFEREAAEQIAGASLAILSALVDKSLLRRDPSGRYHIHELLRQYAAEKLQQIRREQERVQAYHSRYYAAFLRQQERGLKGKKQQESLEAISAEMDNVHYAWQWASAQVELGWNESLALSVIGQSVESLYLFYTIRSRYQEGEAALHRAAMALDTGAPIGEKGLLLGRLLARQGKCCEFTEQPDKAQRLFERSLSLFHRLDAWRETALPLDGMGYLAHMRGEYAQAKQYLQESLAVYRKIENPWGLANVLSNLCLVARRQGAFAEAKEWGQESLTIRREIGDRRGVASSLNNLGLVHCALGEYAEAREALQESLRICHQIGHKVGIANVCTGLCQASFRLGDVEAAEQFGREGLAICQDIGDRWGVAIAFNNLGSIAAETGDYARAKGLFQESLAEYRQIGIKSGLANTLGNLGEACYQLGEHAEARRTLREALKIAWKIGATPILLETLIRLAPLQAQEGKTAQGLEMLALAMRHPATLEESHDKAARLFSELAEGVSPEVVTAARMQGRRRELEAMVAGIVGRFF